MMKYKRSLQAFPESPAFWCGAIDFALLEVGSTPTNSDPCVCTHGHVTDNFFAILTLYVDETLLTGMNASVLNKLKKALMARCTVTGIGEAGIVLGTTMAQDHELGTPRISQANNTSHPSWRGTAYHHEAPSGLRGRGQSCPQWLHRRQASRRSRS